MDEQAGLRDVPASAAGARTTAGRGTVVVTADSCFRIDSLTKIFTSTALIRTLWDKGVPLSTPAGELLPGLAPDWRPMSASPSSRSWNRSPACVNRWTRQPREV